MTDAPPPPPPAPVTFERGSAGGRVNRWVLLGIFSGILGAVLVVAAIVFTAAEPEPPAPPCEGPACRPPTPPGPDDPLAPALVGGELVESDELGYRLDVDTSLWEFRKPSQRDVELRISVEDFRVAVSLEGTPVPTPQEDLQALVDQKVDELAGDVLGLAADTADEVQILLPAVGYRSGAGGKFAGTADTPQGPGSPVSVIVMAASDGEITVVMTVVSDEVVKDDAFSVIDTLMNTFRFPSEVAEG